MATVRPIARVRKSSKSAALKCPTCGSTLVVVKDTDPITTLVCRRCAKRRMGEWLATASGYTAVRQVARKHKSLAMVSADDLSQEVVLFLLEHESPHNPESDGFAEWLNQTVYLVAGRLRNVELSEAKPVDGAVLGAVVGEQDEVEPAFEMANAAAKFYEARKKRIARALGKLSADHREIIKDRFFRSRNLAESARDENGCDSRDRTRLWRAKRKLVAIIDSNGYQLAA